MHDLQNTRKEYKLKELREADIELNPFKQFSVWLNEALTSGNTYPNAMVLSTISSDNRPSSRVVLLKDFSEKGFEFFTNYKSKKAHHLAQQQFASLLFFWPELERQVRIEGKVEKVDNTESDEYFKKRPYESQISAWASPQSSIISSRDDLIHRYQKIESLFLFTPRRPSNWGGYRLLPDLFEFWQGREYRLHDRIEYIKGENGWENHRLAP
jgi:pyridoxamine 5'-phosphate oxidase